MEAVYVGLGIVVAYLLGGLRVLREYERGVYFFLGRLWGAKGPGLIFLPPLFARMQKVSLRVVAMRSEEHTSELQSRSDLVCRLLLEKKKKIIRLFIAC